MKLKFLNLAKILYYHVSTSSPSKMLDIYCPKSLVVIHFFYLESWDSYSLNMKESQTVVTVKSILLIIILKNWWNNLRLFLNQHHFRQKIFSLKTYKIFKYKMNFWLKKNIKTVDLNFVAWQLNNETIVSCEN